MANDELRVVTHGTRELASALRRVSKESTGELKVGFKKIAESVASSIRPKVVKLTGTAASSVKARGSTRGGSIAFGGSTAPYYPWLDFGGAAGPGKKIKRPFIAEGRYVYPTIREKRPEIVKQADEVMERLAKRAGFETHG